MNQKEQRLYVSLHRIFKPKIITKILACGPTNDTLYVRCNGKVAQKVNVRTI